jgi:N-acetylmuramoyl-L-alanine amidase
VGRALASRLRAEGVRASLTRDHDRYLTLRQRSRQANAERPTCFISLHANASPDHARRGIETYVLQREAVDVDARRREAGEPDDVRAVVLDLAQLESASQSIALARTLQRHLVANDNRARLTDRGVKQAGYDVLAGVEVPAVLVELGFIDHPVEGMDLIGPERQEQLAERLAEGILDFAHRRTRPHLAALAR